MPLSETDINRIIELGHNRDSFVEIQDGWAQLKNKDGRCVFHTKTRCSIYEHRPLGCQLYPVIFDEETETAIIDSDCIHPQYFEITKENKETLFRLVDTIYYERNKRNTLSSQKIK